jgi:ABC-2 type transport system permease protein
MLKILAIAWNDLKIEFGERSTLVFFLILPLLFTVLVGSALGGGNNDPNADNRFPVLVVDEDNSALSGELRDALEASTVIRADFLSRAEAELQFADKKAPALLTIPAGLGQGLIDGKPIDLDLRKVSDDTRVLAIEQTIATAADQISNAVMAARASVAEAERIRPFADDAAQQAYFDQSLAMARQMLANPPARVEVTRASEVKTQGAGDGFDQSSPGQLVTWVLITLIAVAETFVSERLGGTLRRLLVSPTRKATLLTGKIVGRLAMGIVQMTILIGFGALALGVDWGKSPAALALIMLTFALSAVAFGVMLGSFAKTRSQAGGLTTLFGMMLAALGGAWWPLEITPQIYQTVVKALPSTWAMTGFNDVILRGKGVVDVLPIAGVLRGFSVVFFAVGIRRLRFE